MNTQPAVGSAAVKTPARYREAVNCESQEYQPHDEWMKEQLPGYRPETLPGLAADLVRRKVDVLLTIGPAALRAARDATSAIPIVAVDLESDPVQAGFARSLAQPSGNITGLFLDQPSLAGKWLELIREAVPGTRRF